MNETELISKLASSSAGESPIDTGDLAERVLASIRDPRRASSTRIWLVTATAGCAIALLASIVALQAWSSLSNPLTDLSDAQTHSVMP